MRLSCLDFRSFSIHFTDPVLPFPPALRPLILAFPFELIAKEIKLFLFRFSFFAESAEHVYIAIEMQNNSICISIIAKEKSVARGMGKVV